MAGPQHAAHVVGAQGGTVTTPSGAGVDIPPGALPGDTTITVDSTPEAATPSGGRVMGTVYTFGPEGTKFDVPVTVRLDFDPSTLPPGKQASDIFVYTAPAGTTEFTPLATTVVDATHVAAKTSHFSVFLALLPSSAPILVTAPDAGPPADSGPGDKPRDASTPPATDSAVGEDDAGAARDSATPTDDAGTNGGGSDDAGSVGPKDASVPPGDASTSAPDGSVAADDGGSTGTGDGGSTSPADSGVGVVDAGAGHDAGGGGGATCDPSTRWPAMLASPIVPPSQFAGVNWQNGNTPVDMAQQINCVGASAEARQNPNDSAFTWGANQDVLVEYNQQTRLPDYVQLQGGYTGTVTFFSRKQGIYGNHTYELGVGVLRRDGQAITIDWQQTTTLADELADAYFATFDPSQKEVTTSCIATGQCSASTDASGNPVFGIHGNAPLSFTVTQGTSTVIAVSTSFTHTGGGVTDAGAAGDATTGGDASACVPIPPQIACKGVCGGTSDGCSGKYDCPCSSDAGGGGAPDASACVPIPPQKACLGMCGGVSDGCSGKYDCPCSSDAGGGGPADAGACVPIPPQKACLGMCGGVSDGCSGKYDCPCSSDAGGGGSADASACVPIPPQKACLGMCGGVSDGCSGKYDCPCGSDAGAPVCSSDASKLGVCSDPPMPLCSAFPGTVVTDCTNFPGGGYMATCCPP